jgi:hypothetical protein
MIICIRVHDFDENSRDQRSTKKREEVLHMRFDATVLHGVASG